MCYWTSTLETALVPKNLEAASQRRQNTCHLLIYIFSTHRIQETNEDHGLTWSTVALPHFLSNHRQKKKKFRNLTAKWTQRGIF